MKPNATLTGPEFQQLFRNLLSLRDHLRKAKADKHSQVDLLIRECIAGGINTGTNIVGLLVKLGFDRKHAGLRLKGGVQYSPEYPQWGQRSDGSYYAPAERQPAQ